MLLPLKTGLVNLSDYPEALYCSFTEPGPFGGHTWIGGATYRALVDEPAVAQSVASTLIYTAVQLAGILLAILVAALLNRPGFRGRSIYRAPHFLPVVTMPVAVAMLWRWMYNGDHGLANYLLSWSG
ncbi:hypothetical protein ACIBI9_53830 [Nonomuraea sp. NPDC050451]|uniref:hypothetical protein n=1 Tax=Nonomuraea sp. NPDC050451 TaxID=3364364 RepID=UPI0037B873F8